MKSSGWHVELFRGEIRENVKDFMRVLYDELKTRLSGLGFCLLGIHKSKRERLDRLKCFKKT